MPSCAATAHLDVPATPVYQKRSGSSNAVRSGTVRHHQVHSGTLRYAQVLSETLCFNIGPTVLKSPPTFREEPILMSIKLRCPSSYEILKLACNEIACLFWNSCDIGIGGEVLGLQFDLFEDFLCPVGFYTHCGAGGSEIG